MNENKNPIPSKVAICIGTTYQCITMWKKLLFHSLLSTLPKTPNITNHEFAIFSALFKQLFKELLSTNWWHKSIKSNANQVSIRCEASQCVIITLYNNEASIISMFYILLLDLPNNKMRIF